MIFILKSLLRIKCKRIYVRLGKYGIIILRILMLILSLQFLIYN